MQFVFFQWFVVEIDVEIFCCFYFQLWYLCVDEQVFYFVVIVEQGVQGIDYVLWCWQDVYVQQVVVYLCLWIQYVFVVGLVFVIDVQGEEFVFLLEVWGVEMVLGGMYFGKMG